MHFVVKTQNMFSSQNLAYFKVLLQIEYYHYQEVPQSQTLDQLRATTYNAFKVCMSPGENIIINEASVSLKALIFSRFGLMCSSAKGKVLTTTSSVCLLLLQTVWTQIRTCTGSIQTV